MRKTSLDSVYELAKQDKRIVFIGSDIGAGTLDEFKAEMPNQFFMEGISEAHVVGMAAGMALEGKIVYINTIATFLTRRCYEQVALDCCLHKTRVRLIGSGGGLVYAPLGPTHLAVEDIAIMRALPGMTILAAADAEEMKRMMPHTVDIPGPVYIRLGRGGDPVVTDPTDPFEIGKLFLLKPGKDVLLITTGTMSKMALDAADLLRAQSLDAGVLHVPTLKPLNVSGLIAQMAEIPVILTLEEHSVIGGLGSAISEILAEAAFTPAKRFRRLGLPDAFCENYGSQASLMAKQGLSVERVAQQALELAAGARV
ncbi:transketolase [Geothrix limicola]|uniref:Transketolase n=1 Tax=Geothrix limicola TaxID=2927978 RepID=A0ABQ5QF33_9BACT|nr:transketolase C-terminal domain-containing protein [Geothrix limicola]GLH73173.1 transketolase [Geothrix limicola]